MAVDYNPNVIGYLTTNKENNCIYLIINRDICIGVENE